MGAAVGSWSQSFHSSCSRPHTPRRRGQWLALDCRALSSSADRSSGSPCPLLESDVAAVNCTHYWSSCRQWPAACENTEKEALMVSLSLSLGTPQQWFLAPLVGPSFFLDSSSCAILYPHPLKPSSGSQSQSSLWPLEPEPQYPAPTCPSRQTEKCVRLGSAGWHQPLMQISTLPSTYLLLHSSLRLQSAPSVPTSEGTSQCVEAFPLSRLSPRGTGPVLIAFSFSFFSFCPTSLCRDFLDLLEVWGLLQHSVYFL